MERDSYNDPDGAKSVEAPAPVRRHSRKTILAVALLACVAWLSWQVYRGKRQAAAAAKVQALGGYVIYDYQGKRAFEPQGWEPARKVLGDHYFIRARGAHLKGEQVTSQTLEQIAPYLDQLGLQYLYIEDTRIGDSLVKPVSSVTGLEQLYVQDRRLTDQGYKALQKALPKTHVYGR